MKVGVMCCERNSVKLAKLFPWEQEVVKVSVMCS